jgi:hypothetical protein
MFFRRKPPTLASLDERITIIEVALGIRRDGSPPRPAPVSGRLDAALIKLQQSVHQDEALRRARGEL